MPFVQGHLRNESIAVSIETECAHCSRPLRVEVDAGLRCRVEDGADPLIYVPMLDFDKLKAPSIIDDF
jgi:hypothetical protein